MAQQQQEAEVGHTLPHCLQHCVHVVHLVQCESAHVAVPVRSLTGGRWSDLHDWCLSLGQLTAGLSATLRQSVKLHQLIIVVAWVGSSADALQMADEISVGKAAQARGLTKSSSAKAAATAGKAAAGPKGKVSKSTKAAQKREDKQSAKGAAKPDMPSPWQISGLEQLANAASWQAEKEHISVGGPEPSQDQSTVSELQTVRMSHSKGSATQSRELGALDSTGRGGLQLHLTDTASEGSGAARQHAPSAAVPATSAPAEVRAATAAVPAGAPDSAPGKCQQHEDSCEPAQDAASLQPGPERSGRGPASGGVPAGELPALASGGIPPHSLADQEFVMSSAYEAPPGSITAMRGFHSDPAASMAYRCSSIPCNMCWCDFRSCRCSEWAANCFKCCRYVSFGCQLSACSRINACNICLRLGRGVRKGVE